ASAHEAAGAGLLAGRRFFAVAVLGGDAAAVVEAACPDLLAAARLFAVHVLGGLARAVAAGHPAVAAARAQGRARAVGVLHRAARLGLGVEGALPLLFAREGLGAVAVAAPGAAVHLRVGRAAAVVLAGLHPLAVLFLADDAQPVLGGALAFQRAGRERLAVGVLPHHAAPVLHVALAALLAAEAVLAVRVLERLALAVAGVAEARAIA